eukprot:7557667-Pyramimonas_sp.AAC.1
MSSDAPRPAPPPHPPPPPPSLPPPYSSSLIFCPPHLSSCQSRTSLSDHLKVYPLPVAPPNVSSGANREFRSRLPHCLSC